MKRVLRGSLRTPASPYGIGRREGGCFECRLPGSTWNHWVRILRGAPRNPPASIPQVMLCTFLQRERDPLRWLNEQFGSLSRNQGWITPQFSRWTSLGEACIDSSVFHWLGVKSSSQPSTVGPLLPFPFNDWSSQSGQMCSYTQWAKMQFIQRILHYWCLNLVNCECKIIKIVPHFKSHCNSLVVSL